MRGCLSVLAVAAVFVAGLAWFAGPPLAEGLIGVGLGGAGFSSRATTVRVTSEPPFEVVGGHADTVTIGADGASFGDLEATRVDLVLTDVDLFGRRFARVDGVLTGVRVRREDGAVPIGRVELRGVASAAAALITMDGRDVERLASDALNDRLALPVVGASLVAPDLLQFRVAGQGFDGRLVIDPDGSLTLAVPLPGTPRLLLVDPEPLVLESVTVAGGQLVLTGSLDVASVLTP
jgi:hypothetical protein